MISPTGIGRMGVYLSRGMCRYDPGIYVNDSGQCTVVTITNSLGNIPSWQVGYDAVGRLRWRSVTKLGLRSEDDHDDC